MDLIPLSVADVIKVHEEVIFRQEIQGLASGKSLESALNRIDRHIEYGSIVDVYDAAALYAEAISMGHCFNDANKRTAATCLQSFLVLNGVNIHFHGDELGVQILHLVEKKLSRDQLAAWLRNK